MKFLNIPELASLQDAPPPLRKGETYVERDIIDTTLDAFWKNGKEAWLRNENEEQKHFTYGEITMEGVRKMIQLLGLEGLDTEDKSNCEQPIVFYDLGSGAGKLVTQMFLENVAHCSIGVELSEHRHSLAENNWTNLRSSSEVNNDEFFRQRFQVENYIGQPRVQFINQDIRDADFSDATHLYVSSLCFAEEVTEQICEIIMENHRRFGKLRAVVALSNLPLFETDESREHWKMSFELIQMTWGLSTARLYRFVG